MSKEVQQIEKGTEVTFTMGCESWYKGDYLGLDYLGPKKEPAHRVIIKAQLDASSNFMIGESYYLSATQRLDYDAIRPGVQLYRY